MVRLKTIRNNELSALEGMSTNQSTHKGQDGSSWVFRTHFDLY